MYVDDMCDYKDFILVKSNIIDDGIWNFICNINSDSYDKIESIFDESKLLFINRIPRFYFLKNELNNETLNKLLLNYNLYCKDSWFCTDVSKLDLEYRSSLTLDIKISNNKEDVIETIMKGFSTGDPDDPYGDLSPTYRQSLEEKFDLIIEGIDTLHYVAYYLDKPISIATISINSNIAYLNNVTTLKEFKGNGVAKELLSYLIKDLKNRNVKEIIFATETDEYTEKFYKKLGFEVVEYGYCFEEK
jgi:GNAT superfamily N-acetyltransferase